MKITFLPKSKLGKWSVILTVASWVLFVVCSLVLKAEDSYSGFDFIVHNPIPVIATVIVLGAGVAALVTGLISVVKKQERSILVYLAILLGFYSSLSIFGVVKNVFFD